MPLRASAPLVEVVGWAWAIGIEPMRADSVTAKVKIIVALSIALYLQLEI
jgi:hypothetical protein